MESTRPDCSVGSVFRVVGSRSAGVVVACLIAACSTPTSAPRSGAQITVSAVDLEAALRRDAAIESDSARGVASIMPVRDVSFAEVFGGASPRPAVEMTGGDRDPLETIADAARRRVDLSIAPITAPVSEGTVSMEATRRYLAGRTAIADGRPNDAIEPLRESVRRGGGVAAIRALADAYDRAGRTTEATDTRRELARRGALEPEDRALLVEALVRRRATEDALAVQAVGVVQAVDAERSDQLLLTTIRFAELLDLAGRDGEARQVRLAVDDWATSTDLPVPQRPEERAALRRFWIEVGDDSAMRGEVARAADRWRRAARLERGPALRARRLRAALALGHDLGVQALLLEAADAPTADDLAFASGLGTIEPPVDTGRLAAILDEKAAVAEGFGEALRMLVAIDPVRGAITLERLATENRVAVAGPLVTAAFAGGPTAAIRVAASLDASIEGMDAGVDALLGGPVDAEALLATLQDESIAGSPVVAEVWRRHQRPDLAARTLASADPSDVTVRIAMLRLAADLAEPTLVLGVPDAPFDRDVELARILGLLASGEPELARVQAMTLCDRLPDDPAALAVLARVESTRRGGEVDAVEIGARARRAGDRSLATMLDLAGFATEIPDGDLLTVAARRTLAELADDPGFRAILEADAALTAGDPTTAISRLEPRLGDASAREAVLMRLLAAWRAAGRLAEGRLRIARLCGEHPADPVLADALFAIDRATEGPRAVAIELRPKASRAISGHPRRRLDLALSEIPESAAEARRVSLERLECQPEGPARDIQRLAILLDAEDEAGLKAALSTVETLDPNDLTPRLRRRLASVAAAVRDRRGADLVDRLTRDLATGFEIDVDTAVAMATALDPETATARLSACRPAPPWTRLDPDWQPRVAALAARDPRAADIVAALSIADPPVTGDTGSLLRTAIAVSVLAGRDAASLLERLDRAAAIGWDPVAAWPDGDAADLRRLAALASDATMLGREDLSIELMELALDARPDDPVLLNNLGYALLETGRLDEATPLLERSRELDPESASTLDSIGWLHFHLGRHDPDDPESAISLIRRSVAVRIAEGRGPSAEVLLHLADASWAAGDRATAEDIWQRLAAPIAPADRQRRLAGIRSYQFEVWGGELVPSESIDDLLEGRWGDRARARLQAIRRGLSPIEVPGVIPPPDA